ncbi:ABC transporter permease subunit [Streptomyces sp. NPDC001833]|uniref:ABC transporter permease subunit n=1 Tax=Streptomyces sp. NPDC001833 TaxID=3154658 RepID=UPI003333C4CF
MLDSINADYVRTARTTGLTPAQAVPPARTARLADSTATSEPFSIPAIFTGAVITETVFGWKGMGQYFVQTIAKNDAHGAVSVAAFGAAMTAIGAVLADIAVVPPDPRVRVS